MGIVAVSVILKLFINGNEICHALDAPQEQEQEHCFKPQLALHDPKGTEK